MAIKTEKENTSTKVQVLAIINVPQQIVLTCAEKTTADERKLMQKCY